MLLPDAFLAHLQQPKCQSWSCSAPLSESSCREHRKSYCCSCCIDLCRIQNHRDAGSDRFLTAVCSAEGVSPSLPSSILTSPDSSGTMKCPTQSVGVSEFWCTGKHLIVRSHLQTSRQEVVSTTNSFYLFLFSAPQGKSRVNPCPRPLYPNQKCSAASDPRLCC